MTGELDPLEVVDLGLGTTEPGLPVQPEEHGSHSFLYLPDLASTTGWSGHRVPERPTDRPERPPMGFARRDR